MNIILDNCSARTCGKSGAPNAPEVLVCGQRRAGINIGPSGAGKTIAASICWRALKPSDGAMQPARPLTPRGSLLSSCARVNSSWHREPPPPPTHIAEHRQVGAVAALITFK
jgi:hypothetical protein